LHFVVYSLNKAQKMISHFLKKIAKFSPVRSTLFFFYGRAASKMSKELAAYIAPGNHVLDLGCGTGIIAGTVAKTLNASLVGTDVIDIRQVDIPFVLYDGEKIPFPDKSFDIVLISYVLHHVEKVEILLQEARRVCRGRIIIYEDTPQNLFHRASCFFHGFSYGSLFGIKKKCAFHTREEWLSLFQKLQLSLMHTQKIKFFNPVHITARNLFVLSPDVS